ncbi:hypothetical protein HQ531_12760 [bacterium]|nr:hypothetical protein [bacterium]
MAKTTKVTGSFYEAMRQLWVVLISLIQKNPTFPIIILIILAWIIMQIAGAPQLTTSILCFIVTILSWAIYISRKDFGETGLTFILGLFTVFSVDWNTETAALFITFFLFFTILIMMTYSVRLAADKESILTQAAIYYSPNSSTSIMREFERIVSSNSKHGMLSINQRSAIVRFFAFRRVPLDHMSRLLDSTELIFVVADIESMLAARFIHSLYLTLQSMDGDEFKEIGIFLDRIITIACSPTEFFQIFDATKRYLLKGTVNRQEYIKIIDKLFRDGFSVEDIETHFISEFE